MIVVYCPGRMHTQEAVDEGRSRSATPKILVLLSRDAVGTVRVQCPEGRCKRSAGEGYNGWYDITIADGTYRIEPVRKSYFDLKHAPGVVMGGT